MTTILAITSSPSSQGSVTTALVDQFVENWTRANSNTEVVARNVASSHLPHLDESLIGAFYTPEDQRSDAQKQELSLSDAIVDEAEAADVIVIGSPMHNFGISSSLKAWIDHLSRVGRTFAYTETGPQGMLTNKKVFVLTARGGNYAKSGTLAHLDQQEPYLRTVLGFMGMTDVTFIHAEGVASGTEGREAAEQQIERSVQDAILSIAA